MYPTQFDETIPGRVSSSWTPQQGLSHPQTKPFICSNINSFSPYAKANMRRTRGASMFMADREPNGDTQAFAGTLSKSLIAHFVWSLLALFSIIYFYTLT